jgi:hypothetical protein
VAGAGEVIDLVVAFGQQARCLQPPEDVPAAVGTGQPDVLAGGKGYRAARRVDLAGELDARGGCADDEDPAVRELAGLAVGERGERRQPRGDGVADIRDRWQDARSGRQHHRPGAEEVVVCEDLKAPRPGAQAVHRGGGADRCGDETGVAGQGGHDAVDRHEPVWVVAGVVVAWQPGLPVWGEQPKARPALGPPRVRHLTALQDDMVDGALGEAAAHGQAGVPGTDDNGRGLHHAGVWSAAVRPARRAPSSGWSRCRTPPSASATGRSAP